MNYNELDFLISFLSESEEKIERLKTKLTLVEFSDSRYRPGPGQRTLAEEDEVYMIVPRLFRKCLYHAILFLTKLRHVIEYDVPPIINEASLDIGAASAVGVDEGIYFDFDSFVLDLRAVLENHIEIKILKVLHLDLKKGFRDYWKETRKKYGAPFLDVIRNEISHIEFWGSSLAQTVNVTKSNGKLNLIFPSNFWINDEKTDIAHLFVVAFNAFLEISERILVFLSQSRHLKFDQKEELEIYFNGFKVMIPSLVIIKDTPKIEKI
jgi:hypothetical protein